MTADGRSKGESDMSWLFSETEESPSPRGSFVSGLVVGALALAAIWTAIALATPDATDGPRAVDGAPGGGATVLGTETAAPRLAAASGERPCQAVYDAQGPALRAAATSLRGWRVHVEAMNQLVAGEITLSQASDFWNRTRRQAGDRLAAYDDAAAAYAARTTRCPATAGDPDATTSAARADCRAAVTARNVTLRRADAALTTWREHVHHMEMLRDGTLDPDRATRLWQQSWRAGVAEIRAYDRAERHHAATRC
jgi:hypothetical protein